MIKKLIIWLFYWNYFPFHGTYSITAALLSAYIRTPKKSWFALKGKYDYCFVRTLVAQRRRFVLVCTCLLRATLTSFRSDFSTNVGSFRASFVRRRLIRGDSTWQTRTLQIKLSLGFPNGRFASNWKRKRTEALMSSIPTSSFKGKKKRRDHKWSK